MSTTEPANELDLPPAEEESQDDDEEAPAKVVVTDINLPFTTMVGLLVQIALAAIPAMLILAFLVVFTGWMLKSLLGK